MKLPDALRLIDAVDATWPPRGRTRGGPFVLREGAGGGMRVSSASLDGPLIESGIDVAEAGMRAMGQPPLFRLSEADSPLDAALAARGYREVAVTMLYSSPIEAALRPGQMPLDAVASPVCLGIHADLWARGGVGPARLAVMERVAGPRCWILGRKDDRAAGTAFAALSGDIAMVHAIEVTARFRRRGVARAILHRAAKWAANHGARFLGLAVTVENAPARALYESLGMASRGRYHYRMKTEDPARD